ncbi:hypothetical protein MHYP_G00216660 [Metynnis hypsauchen]
MTSPAKQPREELDELDVLDVLAGFIHSKTGTTLCLKGMSDFDVLVNNWTDVLVTTMSLRGKPHRSQKVSARSETRQKEVRARIPTLEMQL